MCSLEVNCKEKGAHTMNTISENSLELLLLDSSNLLNAIRNRFDMSGAYYITNPDKAREWIDSEYDIIGAAVNTSADIIQLLAELYENGNIKVEVRNLP
jgi:hypothetical protein